uniref:Arachidonate 12-lipoxygenase n=1 Tax=Neogobius melanostomus TaxID=47308 RepID=A0A8C6WUB0_9GOBI
METYTVIVATGTSEYAGTNNYIYVTLVGEQGESERTLLDNPGLDFCRGAVDKYQVSSPSPLGPLLLVRLEKQRYWVEDNWFCRYVTVESPRGHTATFPCYRWLVGDTKMEIREGPAKKLKDDSLPELLAHRKAELRGRQKTYRWLSWAPGIPRCIDAKSEADLPQDVRFDNEKRSDFEHSLHYKLVIRFGKSWNDLEDFRQIFWKLKSPIAEYCMEHWKEDWFFGYQCLNGCNPRMIQQCNKLPDKFPVTADMVQSSLCKTETIMEGLPANVIKNEQQYIAAPLCLLYQHPDDGLIPIAIQLGQTPGVDTPVFLPSDPPLAWLLAKTWVRHSEFQVFQVLSHLLRTHLVVEVFCVATLRQLPAVHPVYKLLAPHQRYTLEINCRGRTQLISSNGIFKRVVSTGGDALLILAQREYKVLTYRSLHPRHDFIDRGVTRIPKYFYRDNVLLLWDTIHGFVSGMVSLYYKSDSEVEEDQELQAWIRDVTDEGFAELPDFGLPSSLSSREELSTLLAVVILSCSAQHAATNNGQFDWCAWVPNTPCTMRQPPPTDKDTVTMDTIMSTLPDVSQSCVQLAITWHLVCIFNNQIPIGHYTEEHFTEKEAQDLITKFRKDLANVEEQILRENEGLELQYLVLLPSRVESSITI